MTEAELIESLQLAVGNTLTAYGIFLSLATSFIVITQIAGRSLTRSQMWLAVTLYSIAMVIMIGVLQGQNILADSLRLEQAERFPRGSQLNFAFAPITFASNMLIYLGSLKYMWDVRKRSERADA